MDAKYASLRYQLVPHQVSSSSILGTALSTNAHVTNVQSLFQEASAPTTTTSSSSSSTATAALTLAPTLIYRVHCEADDARYEPFDRLPAQQQMWYGIRKCELGGVLSHGIPFPSAEAPTSSYPYGKCIQLSSSPLVAAKRCLEFEPLQQTQDDDDDDDDSSVDNTIILGLCTVACGNMHTIAGPNIYRRPPVPCHSIRVDHSDNSGASGASGQEVFIYDIGQIHLDSIVYCNATTGTSSLTSMNVADEIMAEAAQAQSGSSAPVAAAVVVADDEDGVETLKEASVVEEEQQQDEEELVGGLKSVELEERPLEVELEKAIGDTGAATSSLDFANQILAEAANASIASP